MLLGLIVPPSCTHAMGACGLRLRRLAQRRMLMASRCSAKQMRRLADVVPTCRHASGGMKRKQMGVSMSPPKPFEWRQTVHTCCSSSAGWAPHPVAGSGPMHCRCLIDRSPDCLVRPAIDDAGGVAAPANGRECRAAPTACVQRYTTLARAGTRQRRHPLSCMVKRSAVAVWRWVSLGARFQTEVPFASNTPMVAVSLALVSRRPPTVALQQGGFRPARPG